jgi:hypothetical protein
MDDILPLTKAHKLPEPVLKPVGVPHVEDSAASEHEPAELEAAPLSPRLAAYQALPVTKSTITHNYTPALAVLDADDMDKEVPR